MTNRNYVTNKNYIDYPFQVDQQGRTSITSRDKHVRNMIYLVLFTNPGERVNRPDFGCGLLQLLFSNADPALAATLRFTVQGALQRWLGDLIEVQDVVLEQRDSQLTVQVVYLRLDSGEVLTDTFES